MTLAQNAQVQKALNFYEGAYLSGWELQSRDTARQNLIEAVRLALLAEWNAGEESLSLIDAYKATNTDPDLHGATWEDVGKIFDVLDTQHRARLAAERSKWVSEVETLRGQVVAKERVSEFDLGRWRTAEARVQRLEAALDGIGNELSAWNLSSTRDKLRNCIRRAMACVRAALLPEETTK